MPNRKVTYRLYPNAGQAARLLEMLGLHQRLYNTALEERIRVYKATGKGLSFADQCKALTQWRKNSAGLRSMNPSPGRSRSNAWIWLSGIQEPQPLFGLGLQDPW